jgi:hypothetical protein
MRGDVDVQCCPATTPGVFLDSSLKVEIRMMREGGRDRNQNSVQEIEEREARRPGRWETGGQQPVTKEEIQAMDGFWPCDTRATKSSIRIHYQQSGVRALMEEPRWSTKILHSVPQHEASPVSIVRIPVQQETGRG